MLLDGLMVGASAFGAGVFCFVAGYIAGCSRREGFATFPLSHVSFDSLACDVDRLRLLDEARAAVLDGRLSQAKSLKNCSATNQRYEPGDHLEE